METAVEIVWKGLVKVDEETTAAVDSANWLMVEVISRLDMGTEDEGQQGPALTPERTNKARQQATVVKRDIFANDDGGYKWRAKKTGGSEGWKRLNLVGI